MLRSVLVPLDDSCDGEAAQALGLRWAEQYRAELIALGIVDGPGILRPESLPLGSTEFKHRRDQALLKEARDRIRTLRDRFESRCAQSRIVCRTIEVEGDPAERIVWESQRGDLIVMGLHGNFHFATSDQEDGTLARVVRDCPRPVVAVPESWQGGAAALVAYDGSLQASRALSAFVTSGLASDRDVRLLCVGTDHESTLATLKPAREFLGSHGVNSTVLDLLSSQSGDPASEILNAASDLRVGLIVMGAYGQPRLREFLIGSVTRKVMRRSPRPLFLYH